MDKNATANTWDEVVFFRVYKAVLDDQPSTINLFNNTRQRCPIRVAIEVLKDKDPVSNPDLSTLQLVDFDRSEPLTAPWQVFDDEGEYDWDESIIQGAETASSSQEATSSVGQAGANRQRQVRIFHVATSATGRQQIGARIRIPGTNAYAKTTDQISDPDGYGDHDGRFNSSVIVNPVTLSLPAGAYGEVDNRGVLVPHRVGREDLFYRAAEHRISITQNGRAWPLKSISGSPSQPTPFSVYKQGNPFDGVYWSMSYFGQPGSRSIGTFPVPPLMWLDVTGREGDSETTVNHSPLDMFNTLIGAIDSPSQTHAVVGLITGNVRASFKNASGSVIPDVTSQTMYLMDAYGNLHTLSLSYYGSRADELRLSKA